MSDEIILTIHTSKEVADSLQDKPGPIKIESVEDTQEQAARFGIVDIVSILGVVKGITDVIKLALDIRDLLKKKTDQKAELSTAGQHNTYIIINGSMTNEEIENVTRKHFNN